MAVQYKMNLDTSYKSSPRDATERLIMGILPQLVDEMASFTISDDQQKTKREIAYDFIEMADSDAVLDLLKRTFFKDEPLNNCIGLTDDGECKDLEEYCLKSIPDRWSFKAVDVQSGKIVGVILNGIIAKPDSDAPAPPSLKSKAKHQKFKLIMGLMDLIDSKFDTFTKYPDIEAFVDGKILAVDPDCRGLGIAGQLTQKTVDHMRENGLEIFQMLCTSHFSARVCEKLGFGEIFYMPFTEYVDDEGKQVLTPEKPHVAARIFTQKV